MSPRVSEPRSTTPVVGRDSRRTRLDAHRGPRRASSSRRRIIVLVGGMTALFASSIQNRQSTTAGVVARDYAEALNVAVARPAARPRWCSTSYTVTPPHAADGLHRVPTYGTCPATNAATTPQFQPVVDHRDRPGRRHRAAPRSSCASHDEATPSPAPRRRRRRARARPDLPHRDRGDRRRAARRSRAPARKPPSSPATRASTDYDADAAMQADDRDDPRDARPKASSATASPLRRR